MTILEPSTVTCRGLRMPFPACPSLSFRVRQKHLVWLGHPPAEEKLRKSRHCFLVGEPEFFVLAPVFLLQEEPPLRIPAEGRREAPAKINSTPCGYRYPSSHVSFPCSACSHLPSRLQMSPMKRGVPLFILGLSAVLLAGRLAARRLSVLHSRKPRVREGSHSGLRQGWGTPCTL